jgi:hypothetical protein
LTRTRTEATNADLQKQLTGNETAYATAVNHANSAYETATTNAEAVLKSAKQTASSKLTSALARSSKDKDTAVASAERVYDQVVASLDAQYGSSSSNGDTGLEGARRDAAISTRDAQYYASRDTSWASALNSSTSLGTSPWIVKERTSANAKAAYSSSRATAQAAHDAALLSAIDNWHHSQRDSRLSLLTAEGHARETYHVATATLFANWGSGIGKLFADKPDGTRWSDESDESQANEDPRPVSGLVGIFSFDWFGNDEDEKDTSDLPEDPTVAQSVNDNIVLYRDFLKSLPIVTPRGSLVKGGPLKGIRDWGIDIIAGGISLAAHDTIKQVAPSGNADASFFLSWFGTSSIPAMTMGYNKVGIQSVDYLQSIARENALELNAGHAGLGSTSTILLDNIVIEGTTSLATMGATKALTKGAQISKTIGQEIVDLTSTTAQKFDDEIIEAASKSTQILDDAEVVPLEKVLRDAPIKAADLPWARPGAARAAKAIEAGQSSIKVASRDDAAELVWRMFSSRGFLNTTGRSGSDVRKIVGSKAGTYHWDDVLDASGNVAGHGADNAHAAMRHVQVHLENGDIIRIFFP